jgi:hypothetical protein
MAPNFTKLFAFVVYYCYYKLECLSQQAFTAWSKRAASDKHSSISQTFINYEHKKFYNIEPLSHILKLFLHRLFSREIK